MMESRALAPGMDIRFLYPRHNFYGVPASLEVRRGRVVAIRDPAREPLDEATLELNPLLRRQGLLVTLDDFDKHERRSFYSGSMHAIERVEALPETEEVYRIVTIDPAGRETVPVPAMRSIESRSYIAAGNGRTHLTGRRHEAREVRLPRLTRNAFGKVE